MKQLPEQGIKPDGTVLDPNQYATFLSEQVDMKLSSCLPLY
jgi:hypothetical protein